MLVATHRTKGQQIPAGTLFEESWADNPYRSDPRLDMPCLVWDTPQALWWRGPGGGTTGREEEAELWIPRTLFESGYLNAEAIRTIFCFLEPEVKVEIPKAEREFDTWAAAHDYMTDHPKRFFLIRGRRTGRYQKYGILIEGQSNTAVETRNQATVFEPLDISIHSARLVVLNLFYEILPEGWEPPKTKIEIKQILQPKLLEALREMPDNKRIRTQVWSIIKAPIPEDKRTFEEVKTWIEENYDPKPSGLFREPSPGNRELRADGITVEIATRRPVRGFCHYSALETGGAPYSLDADEIAAAAREAKDLAGFVNLLQKSVKDAVYDDPPDRGEEENYEYYDYEQEGGDMLRVEVAPELGDRALQWLYRYHPDLAEKIDPVDLEDKPPVDPFEGILRDEPDDNPNQ